MKPMLFGVQNTELAPKFIQNDADTPKVLTCEVRELLNKHHFDTF